MSTTFHVPENGATSTVASPRTSGGASLVLADGSAFGTVFPKIVTVIRAGTVLCILEATARSGNTLTISGPIEGTTDANMIVDDTVEMRPTKLAMTEIHAAVNNLETITEVPVTTGTTLTSSAWGKVHVLGGTGPFTVTLPTAVGFAGQTIGFRCATGLTGLATLDGNSGETLDGAPTRDLWAGEAAVLESDGSNLVKLSGKSRPMAATVRLTAPQSFTDSVAANVIFDGTDLDNTGLMADIITAHGLIVRRAGTYSVAATVYWSAVNDTVRAQSYVFADTLAIAGSALASGVTGADLTNHPGAVLPLAAGQVLTVNSFTEGQTINAFGQAAGYGTMLAATEIDPW